MLGREVTLANKPNLRIVSLVPSQTELLYELGLGSQIIGQTVFCIHPEKAYKNAVKLGGTKKINIEKIKTLNPDIIIANKEENEEGQISELMKHFPIWVSDIESLDDNNRMITELGEMFDVLGQAAWINQQINMAFALYRAKNKSKRSCVYLIWKDPYMAAGKDTFIESMLAEAGYNNVIENERYPEVDVTVLQTINPDFIFLSSEPFPFKEEHIHELSKFFPKAEVLLVDGEMFSWYGSRIMHAPKYFNELQQKTTNYA